MESDVPLSETQKREAIKVLKGIPFEKLRIDRHYNNKFGLPRHGVTLDISRQIYSQFEKIINVTYRNSSFGRKYCFFYKINKKKSYKLLFFLDKKPVTLFNAIFAGRDIEKRLFKKFGFR